MRNDELSSIEIVNSAHFVGTFSIGLTAARRKKNPPCRCVWPKKSGWSAGVRAFLGVGCRDDVLVFVGWRAVDEIEAADV